MGQQILGDERIAAEMKLRYQGAVIVLWTILACALEKQWEDGGVRGECCSKTTWRTLSTKC
jgi:hypothetical protein